MPLWLRLCTCVVAALLATPSPPGLPLAVTASGQQQHEWLHGLLDARIAAADEVHRQFLEKGNWVARLEVVVRDVQQAAAAAAGAPAAGGGGGVDSRPPPELELSAVRQLVDDVRRLVDSTTGSKASALTNKQLAEVVGAIAAEVLRLPLHNQLSYSLTRRLVMSGLLAVHLHGRRLPPAVQTSVAAMCRKLLRLHQTSAEAKGALEFFHVSKAGGTSLCSLGGINGCRTQYFDPKHNCLVRYFGDAPRWTMRNVTSILPYDRYPWPANVGIKLYSVDCDDRLRYLRSHGWNFYANEYVMHRGGGGGSDGGGYRRAGPCPQFTYVTVLRHPLDRVVSHMNNIVKEYTRK